MRQPNYFCISTSKICIWLVYNKRQGEETDTDFEKQYIFHDELAQFNKKRPAHFIKVYQLDPGLFTFIFIFYTLAYLSSPRFIHLQSVLDSSVLIFQISDKEK